MLTDLGALAGGNGTSIARSINDNGLIVGAGNGPAGNQPVQWLPGATTPLALAATLDGTATAVNAAGFIAGTNGNGSSVGLNSDAVRFAGGNATVLLNNAAADGINGNGTVVGMRGSAGSTATAFRLRDGALQVLPSLPGAGGVTRALAINDQNVTVGVGANAAGQDRALRWNAFGQVQDLGVFGIFSAKGQAPLAASSARDVNASGAIVGGTTTIASRGTAMLWTERRGMQLLPTTGAPGLALGSAMAINDLGQIVATTSSGGAVLLTPTGSLFYGAAGSGSFTDAARWTGALVAPPGGAFDPGVAPNRFIDAVMPALLPGQAASSRVATLDSTTTVKSLLIGSPGTGAANGSRVELQLAAAADGSLPRLTALNGITVTGGGTLAGRGTVAGDLQILRTPAGPGRLAVRDLRIEGALHNRGEIVVDGLAPPIRLQANLSNETGGLLTVAKDHDFDLVGASHSNAGTLRTEDRGAVLRVAGNFSNQVNGLVSTGQGEITFLDQVANDGVMAADTRGRLRFGADVVNNGVVRSQLGGQVTFAGRVSGIGAFTGPGGFVFQAGFAPGNSPASVFVENAVFEGGNVVMELGGQEAGRQHDQIRFGSGVRFAPGVALRIEFIDGFQVQAGDRFQLFDFGTGAQGQLDLNQLPVLGDGLAWDRRDVMAGGWLGVSAVPEPQGWLLACVGVAALSLHRRRQQRASTR